MSQPVTLQKLGLNGRIKYTESWHISQLLIFHAELQNVNRTSRFLIPDMNWADKIEREWLSHWERPTLSSGTAAVLQGTGGFLTGNEGCLIRNKWLSHQEWPTLSSGTPNSSHREQTALSLGMAAILSRTATLSSGTFGSLPEWPTLSSGMVDSSGRSDSLIGNSYSNRKR